MSINPRETHWLLPEPLLISPKESRFSLMKRISDHNTSKFGTYYKNVLGLEYKQLKSINIDLDEKIYTKLT